MHPFPPFSFLPLTSLYSHCPTSNIYVYIVTDLDVLPLCEFNPAYARPRTVNEYRGWKQVHESKVYPYDRTGSMNTGNAEISKKVYDLCIMHVYTSLLNLQFVLIHFGYLYISIMSLCITGYKGVPCIHYIASWLYSIDVPSNKLATWNLKHE